MGTKWNNFVLCCFCNLRGKTDFETTAVVMLLPVKSVRCRTVDVLYMSRVVILSKMCRWKQTFCTMKLPYLQK